MNIIIILSIKRQNCSVSQRFPIGESVKEPIVIPVVHELHVVMGTKGFGRPLVTVWESGHEFPIIF